MIKAQKPEIKDQDKEIEKFIRGAKADRPYLASKKTPKKEDQATYLLRIPRDLREQLRIEAIKSNKDMSSYICDILEKRPKD